MSSIALLADKGPVRAKELAAQISIPGHYLSKVLRKLVEARLLNATKGHYGGFSLGRPAGKIRLIDVLEAVQEDLPAKRCIFGWRKCSSTDPCILHHRWNEVNTSFQNWARRTTLADIQKDAQGSRWLMPPSE